MKPATVKGMVGALFYLQGCSILNRTLMRLKRLRQPKYLLFAMVGVLYFYAYFFRHFIGRRGTASIPLSGASESAVFVELIGALALFVIMFLAWFVPHERAALLFTEAEIAFLFPAPITRRGLIHYKLLRSQLSIFFTTLFLALVTRRFTSHFWIRVGGWWLILSTLNLHFIGSSFARTLLLDRGVSNWKRRLAAAGIAGSLIGLVIWWAHKTAPPTAATIENVDQLKDYAQRALLSGPASYILYPFRMVVRPFIAPDPVAFLLALGPALGLLLLHYWWVVRSDVAFEEASVAASQKLAAKVAAIRSGEWRNARKAVKAKKAPFHLTARGFQPVALLWKNLISAGQAFSARIWIIVAIMVVVMCLALRSTIGASGLLPLLSMLSAIFVLWTLLLGPQLMRQDLRHDLPRADILKMYPMRGWQIVLGELLAPIAILTAIQWLLMLISLGLSGSWPREGVPIAVSLRWAIVFNVAVLAPFLNAITLQIPNGAVLLLPAWFQTGKQGPQGIEATGQRLVFLLASLVVFALALLPAGGVYLAVFLVSRYLLSVAAALPLAALGAALILAIEGSLGVMLLGKLFERYDVSAEQNP